MGYYQGDFYAGARGDPGFFSFLGKVGKGLISAGKAQLGIGRGEGVPQAVLAAPAAAGIASRGGAIVRAAAAQIIKHPVLSAAGAAGVAAGAIGAGIRGRAAAVPMMHPGGALMRGFHISRKTGAVVRNRRMNVANGRALSRAVRRLHSFAKKYRKVVGFVSPRRPKGRMYFRKKKSQK